MAVTEKPLSEELEPEAVEFAAQWPYRFEIVQVRNLMVDNSYQRKLTKLADEIGREFNPALVGTIIVSQRKRGKLAVVDGQTRVAGATEAGVGELPALVYEGMTPQDEASLFALLQRKRRGMASYERFKASLRAREPEALGIDRILHDYGYQVGPKGLKDARTIQAVAALESVYRRGPERLDATVRILHNAWGGENLAVVDVFSAELIRGLDRFMHDVDESDKRDEHRMTKRLKNTTPAALQIQSGQLRAGKGGGGNSTGYMAEVMLGVYSRKN